MTSLIQRTPLCIAGQEGHVGVIGALLAAHADPAVATFNGVLPVEVAARYNHTAAVVLLKGRQ